MKLRLNINIKCVNEKFYPQMFLLIIWDLNPYFFADPDPWSCNVADPEQF